MSEHEDYAEIESIIEKIGAAEALHQLKSGDAWRMWVESEIEKVKQTGILPDYIKIDKKTEKN